MGEAEGDAFLDGEGDGSFADGVDLGMKGSGTRKAEWGERDDGRD